MAQYWPPVNGDKILIKRDRHTPELVTVLEITSVNHSSDLILLVEHGDKSKKSHRLQPPDGTVVEWDVEVEVV